MRRLAASEMGAVMELRLGALSYRDIFNLDALNMVDFQL